jgi:catalase
VRWLLKPEQPITPADETSTHGDNNYLFNDLINAINHKPLQWRLFVVVGQTGDPTNDSSLPWPDDREQVDVGTLTLDRIESDDTGPAKDITFDPLILPDGMSPSDDPLLSARSAVYSQSYTRRAGEPREPSPITPAEVLRSN